MQKLVTDAFNEFKAENFIRAEAIYDICSNKYGNELFIANKEIINSRIRQRFIKQSSEVSHGHADEPWIHYCIPVMNRLSDIQATLKSNLDKIKLFNKVSITINLFDRTDDSSNWIAENFQNEIASGILQVNKLKPLIFWHFSWAKNSFSDFIGDEGIYSSLDGDNYLTIDEIARTKQLFMEFGPSIVHHFSGNWGDGTSGRVSVPASLYKKYGYRNELFPRQFDEMSLMLNILSADSNIPFICRAGADIFSKSKSLEEFIKHENWNPKIINANLGLNKAPENPKSSDYVRKDEKLELFTRINSTFSLLKISKSEQSINLFTGTLKKALKDTLSSKAFEEIARATTIPALNTQLPEISSKITLYSVVKNDDVFLSSWIDHYRNLGVERFIIVDDGSEIPLSSKNFGADVYIFKPSVGDFKNFKVFWIKSLMRQFQKTGSVCICADADEYIDIPDTPNANAANHSRLSIFCKENNSLLKYGRVPGILIDLMPQSSNIEVTSNNFLETMLYCAFEKTPNTAAESYKNYPSIKWAFNEFWQTSYTYDLRFHIYQTFDCLRKFPIFIYGHNIELNQGFHDLLRDGKGEKLHPDEVVLPIRHYKMLKIMHIENIRINEASNYFNRTAQNLNKIHSSDILKVFEKWEKIEKIKHSAQLINLKS